MSDACIAGNNGKADQKPGNPPATMIPAQKPVKHKNACWNMDGTSFVDFYGSSMSEYKIFMRKS